jgi:hypothetical protein
MNIFKESRVKIYKTDRVLMCFIPILRTANSREQQFLFKLAKSQSKVSCEFIFAKACLMIKTLSAMQRQDSSMVNTFRILLQYGALHYSYGSLRLRIVIPTT